MKRRQIKPIRRLLTSKSLKYFFNQIQIIYVFLSTDTGAQKFATFPFYTRRSVDELGLPCKIVQK